MLNLLNLVDYQLNTLHEALGIMVMQNVHVNTLIAAREECVAVLVGLNVPSDSSQDECARIDCFEVATRHLQNHRVRCGHDSHKLCTALDAPTALICLRLVARYLEFW